MDETRLDLRAADQERLEQWRNADRLDAAHLALQSGAAMYPIVGRRGGRLYGTPRRSPVEEAAREDRDEEIRMSETGRVQRPTYEEALTNALHHAQRASEEGRTRSGREGGSMSAEAAASQAWSALARLLRTDEERASAVAMYEEATRQRRERQQDYVRVPSPEARKLMDEAAEVRAEAQKQDGV